MLETLLAKMYFRRRKVIAETILKMDDSLEIFQGWGGCFFALSMNIFCQKEGWGLVKGLSQLSFKIFPKVSPHYIQTILNDQYFHNWQV